MKILQRSTGLKSTTRRPMNLADILIVAATWLWEAKTEAGGNFQPGRSIDVMLLTGAVQFVCGQMADQHDIERLRTVVNLKMRYNELRKD